VNSKVLKTPKKQGGATTEVICLAGKYDNLMTVLAPNSVIASEATVSAKALGKEEAIQLLFL
jgi:hypothetical protein